MTVHDLPAVNATLNGLSTVFISAGWIFIKSDRKQQHIVSMLLNPPAPTAALERAFARHRARVVE